MAQSQLSKRQLMGQLKNDYDFQLVPSRQKKKAVSIYGNGKTKGLTPPVVSGGAPAHLNTVMVNRMRRGARKSTDAVEAEQPYRTTKLSPAARKHNALFDPRANRSLDVMNYATDGSNFLQRYNKMKTKEQSNLQRSLPRYTKARFQDQNPNERGRPEYAGDM